MKRGGVRVIYKIKGKKGIFFTLDALFATILIGIALVASSQYFISEVQQPQITYYSQDIVNSLSNIKISEFNNSYVKSLIAAGEIINLNNTIIEQIGEFYVINKTELARNLSVAVSNNLIPEKFSFEILVNDESVYFNGSNEITELVSTRRLISGIEKFKPLRGATSKVFLSGINNKKFSSYLYFGGFVGQGNISGFVEDIPAAVTINSMYLEVDAGSDFELYVNKIQCGSVFSSGGGIMTADSFDISYCNSSLVLGARNNYTIKLVNDLSTAYLGGGFIRVDYSTSELQQEKNISVFNEWLPGISGIVNLYSSFYVPGILTNMSIYLHYFVDVDNETNNTFYVTVGNKTLFRDSNLTGEKSYIITPNNISDAIAFSTMDKQTVPIRVGFENVSFGYIYEGSADVALVTDISGSMDWNMTEDWSGGIIRNCNDSLVFDQSSRRLSIAKCLDKQFVVDILNTTGNAVGLIAYSSTTDDPSSVSPTTNSTILNSTIGTESPLTGYNANGGTCICCGINSAITLLTDNITRTVLISSGANWLYRDSYLLSSPPDDGSGSPWYSLSYDDSAWPSAPAILGSTSGLIYSPTVTTELSSSLSGTYYYLNLWEHGGDNAGAPNDFSSGLLNATGNTFGLSGADDGWDSDSQNNSGPFWYDDDVDYNNISSGELLFDLNEGGSGNVCTGFNCSGAYGIEIIVNDTEYNAILNGAKAEVSFYYEWDGNDDPFESADEVWIKSYWESPSTGVHYLGSEMSSVGNDPNVEIDFRDNPDTEFSGTYTQDITSWIEGTGNYYLAIGGKLSASASDEWGTFYFDNIQVNVVEKNPDVVYANLWENVGDNAGAPNDFSSGTLNTTGSDFGLSGADDGWDSASGTYDYTSAVAFNNIVGGRLRISSNDNNNDVSGAYGIEINISQEMYDILSSQNGQAFLSFNWWWEDTGDFDSSDQVWVKSNWNSTTTGIHYLGSQQDENLDPPDTSLEIFVDDDPDGDTGQQYHSQEISAWIEGPGTYYLTLGGKLARSTTDEDGYWEFDNIQLLITNVTNHYYFRRHFNLASTTLAQTGILNILADDFATLYLNGQAVYSSSLPELGEYWNARGISIPGSYFTAGDNVLAVELQNAEHAAKFDSQLSGLNVTRDLAMMLMTDGVANYECTPWQWVGDGDSRAIGDAVQAACDAREDYGITVYAVGISDTAEEGTLRDIAECGEGLFAKSDNTTVLQEFYQDVAANIISTSRHSQTIEVEGEGSIAASILYEDSYVRIDYDPIVEPPQFSEISLIREEKNFPNCTFSVNIPSDVRVTDAKLTSYSSEHWTDELVVNNNSVFNLSKYSIDYTPLGDPFIINIPVNLLVPGNNTFFIRTGDSPGNFTECSKNNTFIYRAQFQASVAYSDVLEKAAGCEWFIEFDDGQNTTINVPPDYIGTKNCFYSDTQIDYDQNDTYDDAMFKLLDNLDFDDDGRIYINMEENNLVVGAISVGQVPFPWGPAIAEVRVWR